MLEAAGNFCFTHEACQHLWMMGDARLNLLDGHLAMELQIFGNEDLPQAPLGVRTERAEPGCRQAGRE